MRVMDGAALVTGREHPSAGGIRHMVGSTQWTVRVFQTSRVRCTLPYTFRRGYKLIGQAYQRESVLCSTF